MLCLLKHLLKTSTYPQVPQEASWMLFWIVNAFLS